VDVLIDHKMVFFINQIKQKNWATKKKLIKNVNQFLNIKM
jgi:hypothetical protein